MIYKYLYKTPKEFDDILLINDEDCLISLNFIQDYKSDINLNNYNKDIFDQTIKWLDIYFSGGIPNFAPKYKLINLTPFKEEVFNILRLIPYGKTTTYKEIANEIIKNRKINNMSFRAVGKAVGSNPICIIIPCHRVVGSNGKLIGYSGGFKNKESLLKLEKSILK